MPRLIYLAPEFPPSRATGAIRAARFARSLPDHGWDVTVMTLKEGHGAKADVPPPPGVASKPHLSRVPLDSPPLSSRRGEDLLPLGEAYWTSRPMIDAARTEIADGGSGGYDLILANAPPIGMLPHAARLARKTGLPLVIDLRDPWGPCDTRGPLRPWTTRLIEGRAEARVMRQAAAVILNTDSATDAYRKAFPFAANKMFTLRNTSPRIGPCPQPPFDVFTTVYAGSFARFVPAAPLLALCESLWARGVRPDRFQMLLTAQPAGVPANAPWAKLLYVVDRIPFDAVPALLHQADLLLAVSQPSRLRIPLKTYDLVNAPRPLLMLQQAENPELAQLIATTHAGVCIPASNPEGATDFVMQALDGPRQPDRPRNNLALAALSLETSTARLDQILRFAAGTGDAPPSLQAMPAD